MRCQMVPSHTRCQPLDFRIRYNQDKTHRYITSTCEVGDVFKNNRDVGHREEKDEDELEAGATISQSEV